MIRALPCLSENQRNTAKVPTNHADAMRQTDVSSGHTTIAAPVNCGDGAEAVVAGFVSVTVVVS